MAETQAGSRTVRHVLVSLRDDVVKHAPGGLPRQSVALVALPFPDIVLQVVTLPQSEDLVLGEQVIEPRIFVKALAVAGKVEELLHEVQLPADLRRIQEIPADERVDIEFAVAVFDIRAMPVTRFAAVALVERSRVRGVAGMRIQERQVGVAALLPDVQVRPLLLERLAECVHA